MKFIQHIKEIIFVENPVVSVILRKKMKKKKLKFSQKISCIVDSCIGVGVWTFSQNLWFRICNMGFVQHIKVIILPENLNQNKAEEENEEKKQGFAKNFLLCRLVRRSLGF
jgi:hypothetical protein